MIVDIRFKSESPEQIQKVRRITVYPHGDVFGVGPEIIVYSMHDTVSPRYIPLSEVREFTITND